MIVPKKNSTFAQNLDTLKNNLIMNLVRKSMFTVLITLSTASVYYAQSVKDTLSKEKTIDEVVISGVADIAKDRKTPVAVSTIKEAQIVEKLGNQEFPEILNSTPSVFATKGGGGYGDSNLNIRGFSQANIAVLINGVPVNDMENGAVYWSNWAGLSDVTSTLEVQRGLGSSKLAIASVGGTVNVITRSADRKEGGKFTLQVGNDGYVKTLASYNTGINKKGWSSSFLLGRTGGSTYASGTHFEGYNYYFALGWKPNDKQDFQFTLTGAPQYHNQRSTDITLQTLINRGSLDRPDRRYNSDEGVLNGQEYTFKRNYFNKPVMSLNWNWNISDKSKLNTVAYASFGRGGGTGATGTVNKKSGTDPSFQTADGLINFNAIEAANAASTPDKGEIIRYSSINSHNWFGLISSFNQKITDNLNFTVGFDGRYYKGFHYRLVSDLLGASAYKDTSNKNLPGANYVSNAYDANPTFNPFGGKIDALSDRITYSNVDQVLWYGGFGQIEYSNDNLSAYAQGSISEQGFQRHDDFYLDGTVTKGGVLKTDSPYKNLFGYNAKIGANYNIDEKSNIFVNTGYYSKQPFFNAVYPNNNSLVNPYLTNEKIFGLEAGYGFKSSMFNGKINIYRTSWKDRNLRPSYLSPDKTVTGFSNITGITEIHSGIEFEGNARVAKILQINASASIGNYVYKGNAVGFTFNDSNAPIDPSTGLESANNTSVLYLDKIKVGNAAQTTASLGFTLFPVKDFKFDASYRYVDHIYANLNVTDFSVQTKAAEGALQLPAYGLVDMGASYKFRLPNPKQSFVIRANVYNLLNTYYLQESYTNRFAGDKGSTNQSYKGVDTGNQVFLGFGRTWSTAVAFNF
jgi:iron complex outermembrane receptor protein